MASIDLSIIVPVRNGEATLGACLRAVRNAANGMSAEVIVVDDHSTDRTAGIAVYHRCVVVRLEDKHGPAAARNAGAKAAAGDVIVFVDADVVVPPDAFHKALGRIREGGWDGLTGVISPSAQSGPFAGRLKNLWMHYTYSRLPEQAPLFLTSFAAIRRDCFFDGGRFDENYAAPSVEDTDYGHRLADRGGRIYLDVGLEVEHRRPMEWREALRMDRDRAAALVRLVLRERKKGRAGRHIMSVPVSHYISVMATAAAALFLLAAIPLRETGLVLASVLCVVVSLAFMWPFLSYLNKRRGRTFAVRAAGFMLADNLAALSGIILGIYGYYRGKRY